MVLLGRGGSALRTHGIRKVPEVKHPGRKVDRLLIEQYINDDYIMIYQTVIAN